TTGTNHPRTSWSAIKKLKISLPPIGEQKQIAEILGSVDKRLELQRKRKEKLQRIKKSLMNDLLTGKKRVRF
ncbi:MAG: restriction endonuclease subunit S, partial [Actinobacteria bacterium]|nr:restriction endonuclease subunit S [Actinomycetota bacterium]